MLFRSDSDVPYVYDQEDLAVRLKIAKKISIYSLPVIMVVVILMSYYSYAAKLGDLNYVAPGGLPGHTGSRMDMLYIIGGAGLLVLVVWILAKKR